MIDLAFVIAMRNPAVTSSWERASALTRRTISSTLGQLGGDCRTILVCKDKPIGLEEHRNLHIVRHDFDDPPPGPERMQDKWRKILRGMVAARDLGSRHVMVTDDDDLVSNQLGAFVCANSSPDIPGWLFCKSHFHMEASRWLYLSRRFYLFCGTSAILRVSPDELPADCDDDTTQYPVLAHGHSTIASHYQKIGTPLAELPFHGAIYINGTGENFADFAVGKLKSRRLLLDRFLHTRPLTKRIRREFSLTPLPPISNPKSP